jgi:hypothetical protein
MTRRYCEEEKIDPFLEIKIFVVKSTINKQNIQQRPAFVDVVVVKSGRRTDGSAGYRTFFHVAKVRKCVRF